MGYSHGKKWNEDSIIEEVLKIVKEFNMDTFPTHNELYKYFGDKSLSNAISKHGGTKYFSDKMNLKIKACESKFGEKYELFAIEKILESTKLHSEKMCVGYPYDLLTNKNIKIDVKVSNLFGQSYYSFNLEKKSPTCDVFILFCVNKEEVIEKTIIIPSCVVSGITQIGIGNKSKYDKYIDRWDFITTYNSFYNEILGINHE